MKSAEMRIRYPFLCLYPASQKDLYTGYFSVYTVINFNNCRIFRFIVTVNGNYREVVRTFQHAGGINIAISKEERKILLKAQQGELDAVKMYNALAKTVTDAKDAAVFRQLASEEGGHAAVFKAMTVEVLQPKNTKAILLPILYKVLSRKKLYPMIAKGEYDAEKKYISVAAHFAEVESVKNDEHRHGDMVMALL